MPELPEVETVRRGLLPVLRGARLTRVTLNRPDLRFSFPKGFIESLTGSRVAELARRGKYLLAHLDTAESLIMHLGMSGRFAVDPGSPGHKHAHVVLATEAGVQITFIDPRRFGFMDVWPTADLSGHPRLAQLGPDPFDAAFDKTWLAADFASRRQSAKTRLMDQRLVAGLGNIYVSEALHRAQISPSRSAGTIRTKAIISLVGAVRSVLLDAIDAGGSTLRDYAAADGSPGYFQHSFQVYGRTGEPCARPGCGGTIVRTVQAGRATYHCPACQK